MPVFWHKPVLASRAATTLALLWLRREMLRPEAFGCELQPVQGHSELLPWPKSLKDEISMPVSPCGLARSCPRVGMRCVGLRGAWAASREPLPWDFMVQELWRSRNPNGAEEQAGLVAPQLVQSPFCSPVAFIRVLPVLAAAAGAARPGLAAFAQPWHCSCAPLTSPGVTAWSAAPGCPLSAGEFRQCSHLHAA